MKNVKLLPIAIVIVLATLTQHTAVHAQISIQAQAFGATGVRSTPVNFTATPIGLADCDTMITFQMTNLPYVSGSNKRLDVWRASALTAACQTNTSRSSTTTTPACTRMTTTEAVTGPTQNFAITPRVLFGGACNVEQTYIFYFLASATTPDSTTTIDAANFGTLEMRIDGIPPAAPSTTADFAGDTNITVSWTNPTDAASIRGAQIYVDPNGCQGTSRTSTLLTPGSAPGSVQPVITQTGDSISSTAVPSATLGLTAYGSRAAVAIAVFDNARNESVLSNITCVERIQVEGFFDSYCNEQGLSRTECKARYSCSAGPGTTRPSLGLFLLAVLLGLSLVRKRTLGIAIAVLAAMILVAPSFAHAQMRSEWDRDPQFRESDENFTFELRMGPYQPELPSGIFATNFRGDQGPLLALEIDVHVYRIPYVGPFAFGMGAGWVEWNGPARARTSSNVGETGLSMVPLSGLAVLRIDALARYLHFPLVLSAKIGIDVAYWKAGTAGTTDADGFTAGLRLAGQAALQLDFLEPRAARRLDEEWGINHAELFFELYQSQLGGFGRRMLPLPAVAWSAGLGFTF